MLELRLEIPKAMGLPTKLCSQVYCQYKVSNAGTFREWKLPTELVMSPCIVLPGRAREQVGHREGGVNQSAAGLQPHDLD